jgi:Domain of unknown function (DUF5679)
MHRHRRVLREARIRLRPLAQREHRPAPVGHEPLEATGIAQTGRNPSHGGETLCADPYSGGDAVPEGYCVKEKKKVEIQNPQQVTMKNGRPAIQGTCPDCGTKIFKIGKLE